MAHYVEELPIFAEARTFSEAARETLHRSTVPRRSGRYNQIDEAIDSILANMEEGFRQESDDAFARYLYYSKGSTAEVVRRLDRAAVRGEVPRPEVERLSAMAETLGKMFGGFIKYLKSSGFKDRGRFRFNHAKRPKDSRSKDSGLRIGDPGSKDSGSKDSGSKD